MEITSLEELIPKRGSEIIKLHNGELPTIKTGFKALDTKLYGLPNGGLIVIGTRPSMGKTTFAQNLAYNIATQNEFDSGVLLFSSAISSNEIADQVISDVSGVDRWSIRTDHLNKNDLTAIDVTTKDFEKVPLYIDDTTHMTIAELTARVHRAKDECMLSAIIINDIDLLLPYNRESADYEQQLDSITHGLKNLARELKLPIFLMVSIPCYDAENARNSDPTPTLVDLKQYGSLEKDANVVIFLHRPGYYYDDYDISADELNEVKRNIVELVIRKNNNRGPMATVEIYFNPDKLKFVSLEEE